MWHVSTSNGDGVAGCGDACSAAWSGWDGRTELNYAIVLRCVGTIGGMRSGHVVGTGCKKSGGRWEYSTWVVVTPGARCRNRNLKSVCALVKTDAAQIVGNVQVFRGHV